MAKNDVIPIGQVYLIIILLTITACSRKNNTLLDKSLGEAGNNRPELEKVLDHYKNDALKLEAAQYLIANMSGLSSQNKQLTEICSPFYDEYDSLAKEYDYEMNKERGEKVDSLWNLFAGRHAQLRGLPHQPDLENIAAAQLISEIDLVFNAWKGNIYTRDCSFEEFCEYILPYRRMDGLHIDEARKTFYEKHHADYFTTPGKDMIDEADSLLYQYRHLTYSRYWVPRMPILSASAFEYLRHGACEHRCWYNSLLFSSLGMAVAIDFVPLWGNRNNGHSWNVLIREGKSHAFEPYWDDDRWKYKRIYNNETFDYTYGRFRLAKVYRYSYKEHIDGPIADKRVKSEDIPDLFNNTRKKDVSHEYFDTVHVTVQLKNILKNTYYAYLCVLGYHQWRPVQWGKIKKDRVTFQGMGKDIVYLPCYYKNGSLIHAGEPFLLNREGEIETFTTDRSDTEELYIKHYTGAPQHHRNKSNNISIEQTTIYGSLSPAFSEGDTIVILPDTIEVYNKEIGSRYGRPVRYIRISLPHRKVSFSNLAFYYKNAEREEKKIETPTLIHPPDSTENGEIASYIFDQYIATGYQRELDRDYIDIDLGSEYSISSICFAPYFASGLKKEKIFELFYWNEGWQYLDIQEGSDKHLIFKNVPKGALLLLRHQDIYAIPETRPFIYRGNEVLWY